MRMFPSMLVFFLLCKHIIIKYYMDCMTFSPVALSLRPNDGANRRPWEITLVPPQYMLNIIESDNKDKLLIFKWDKALMHTLQLFPIYTKWIPLLPLPQDIKTLHLKSLICQGFPKVIYTKCHVGGTCGNLH